MLCWLSAAGEIVAPSAIAKVGWQLHNNGTPAVVAKNRLRVNILFSPIVSGLAALVHRRAALSLQAPFTRDSIPFSRSVPQNAATIADMLRGVTWAFVSNQHRQLFRRAS